MRQRRKMKALSAIQVSNKLKRELVDEDDEFQLEPMFLESDEDVSGIGRSRYGSSVKRVKRCLKFSNEELENIFKTLDFSNHKIIFGRPVTGKVFFTRGSVKLFSGLSHS